jgi:hypothetical protein
MNQNTPDTTPPTKGGWRTATVILGAALLILIGGFGTMLALGWRLQRQQEPAANQPAAAGSSSASAEKWSPPLGPGESAASRVKRLAHDVSSLSLASTNRPDPSKVLTEAQDLAAKGQYEEALQRHIWYHNHALEYSPSQLGVRLSFALSSWIDLGRKYPKARQALIEIRDRGHREVAEGRGDFALFQEVTSINGYTKTEDDTVALFKTVLAQDPKLAQQCYPLVEDLLLQKGDYELCLGLIADPRARFNAIFQERDRTAKLPSSNPQVAAMQQKHFDERFVRQTRALIEILVANGRKPEAEKIQAQALTVMDDPALASAVQDLEKKLGK